MSPSDTDFPLAEGAIRAAFEDLRTRLGDICDITLRGRHPNIETALHHIAKAEEDTLKWLTNHQIPSPESAE